MNSRRYTVIAHHENGKRTFEFTSKRDAQQKFRDCVTSAPCGGIVAVEALSRFSGLFASWREDGEHVIQTEKLDVRFAYKIHGFDTTRHPRRSANTAKWYTSLDDAINAAKRLAARSNNDEALVIYKAIKIVRKREAPVIVEDIE